jgi:hypothetical protein
MATLWVKQSSSGVERKSPVVPIEMRQNDWLGTAASASWNKGIERPGQTARLTIKGQRPTEIEENSRMLSCIYQAQRFACPTS